MSYVVKLWDGTEIIITPEQADLLKRKIKSGGEHVEVNDQWFKVSAIAKIAPSSFNIQSDIFNEKQIAPPPEKLIKGSLKSRLKSHKPKVYKRLYG